MKVQVKIYSMLMGLKKMWMQNRRGGDWFTRVGVLLYEVPKHVMLSAAKNPRVAPRGFFAALSMTRSRTGHSKKPTPEGPGWSLPWKLPDVFLVILYHRFVVQWNV